jgi:hypothetical protein
LLENLKNLRYSFKTYFITAISFLIILLLLFFNNYEKILYFPLNTPGEWCDSQPCIILELFSSSITLVQPTSTFFVYFLGILTVLVGLYLLKLSKKQQFITWWGIALLLWGVGALFAGTSYQAFSYELKCAGRTYCIWTSWWEVVYLILTVGSLNAMMVAQANFQDNKYERIMKIYAMLNYLIYLTIAIIGSIFPIQFLISFELMLIILVPNILIFIVTSTKQFRRSEQKRDFYFLGIWVFLILIILTYFIYYFMGITEALWEINIWFSENDVLHIALIFWMVYILHTIRKYQKIYYFQKSDSMKE